MIDSDKDVELNPESDEDLEVTGEGISGGAARDIQKDVTMSQSVAGKLPSTPPKPPPSVPPRAPQRP